MARNGSGTYNKVNTFIAGDTITAASHNANWDDAASELTNSVAADGQTPMTGALKHASGTVAAPSITFSSDVDTGFYRSGANEISMAAGGAQVASFGTATAFFAGALVVSATATFGALSVSDFTSTANFSAPVTFSATANFSSAATFSAGFIASATAAFAGEIAVSATAAFNPVKFNFITAPGTPTGGVVVYAKSDKKVYAKDTDGTEKSLTPSSGAWVLISTSSPSSAATVDLTGFNAALYSDYRIVVDQLAPATDGDSLWIRTSANGGGAFDAGASNYNYAFDGRTGAGNTGGASTNTAFRIIDNAIGNATGEGVSGEIYVINPGATARCRMTSRLLAKNTSGQVCIWNSAGERDSAAAVDGIRILFSSGNIASGTVRFYGLTI